MSEEQQKHQQQEELQPGQLQQPQPQQQQQEERDTTAASLPAPVHVLGEDAEDMILATFLQTDEAAAAGQVAPQPPMPPMPPDPAKAVQEEQRGLANGNDGPSVERDFALAMRLQEDESRQAAGPEAGQSVADAASGRVGCTSPELEDLLLALQLQAEEDGDEAMQRNVSLARGQSVLRPGSRADDFSRSMQEGDARPACLVTSRADSSAGAVRSDPWGVQADDLLLALRMQSEEMGDASLANGLPRALQPAGNGGSSERASRRQSREGGMQSEMDDLLLALELQGQGSSSMPQMRTGG
mmetsp:Transcript_65320/g.120343  ORF Transcript_65320/g.120343 Transcript_65320/m.120343 type:complete len:299 (-) Transcript_65320:14-910(-)